MTAKPDKKEALRHFLSLFPEKGLKLDIDETVNMCDVSDESVRAGAMKALYKLREEAERNGTMGMSLDEINAEIAAARAERDAAEKTEQSNY